MDEDLNQILNSAKIKLEKLNLESDLPDITDSGKSDTSFKDLSPDPQSFTDFQDGSDNLAKAFDELLGIMGSLGSDLQIPSFENQSPFELESIIDKSTIIESLHSIRDELKNYISPSKSNSLPQAQLYAHQEQLELIEKAIAESDELSVENIQKVFEKVHEIADLPEEIVKSILSNSIKELEGLEELSR